MAEIKIIPERPGDAESIYAVNASAFATHGEAELVAKLRCDVAPWISLVATVDTDVVGHILFTPVDIQDDERPGTAIALAPVAVLPEHQNRGIGSALVRKGLSNCEATGEHVVFVLGHTTYYPRFGFEPAWPRGLYFNTPEPNPAFFVLELQPAALGGRRGEVRYHRHFYDI